MNTQNINPQGGDEPIIIGGPRPQGGDEPVIIGPKPRLTIKPTGIVPYWRQMWKQWSSWLLVAAFFMPDIMGAMIAQGWVTPSETPLAFKIAVGLTFAAKFVNQKIKES